MYRKRESRSIWYILCDAFLPHFQNNFLNNFRKVIPGGIEFSSPKSLHSADVSDPSEVPWFVCKLIFIGSQAGVLVLENHVGRNNNFWEIIYLKFIGMN